DAAARDAESRARLEARAAAALEKRIVAERAAEARESARAGAESAAADALRARMTAQEELANASAAAGAARARAADSRSALRELKRVSPRRFAFWAPALAALGVVFGDIGTSPLYAVKETFSAERGIPFSPGAVLGGLSTIFWALI